ncbi:MAG TPA: lamin tail domain-containing protein, partial [Bacteroidales bacterium]
AKQSNDFVKALNNEHLIDSSIIKDNKIKVYLKDPIACNQHYCFLFTGIQDMHNNTARDTTICFYLFKPKAFDVVVSEIMADPSPSAGLPEFEYLELFNRSDTSINLENWQIHADNKMVKLPKVVLEKDSFLIVSYKNAKGVFDKYGKTVYCLPDVYFLNNGGANISIADSTGQMVSYCWYADSWHTDAIKKKGGWSLEWADKSDLCGGSYSWKASKSKTGGTPGKKNSEGSTKVNDIKIKPSKILVPNDSTLIVSFNKPVDIDAVLDKSLFQIGLSIVSVVNVKFGANFYSLELFLSGHLEKGVTYTLNFSDKICDCNGKPIVKTELSFVLPLEADSNDLVINEVLFNPYAGSTYFVEFYNRSDKPLDIGSLYFARFDTLTNEVYNFCSISEQGSFLMPHKIMAICKDTLLLSKFYKLYDTCVVLSNRDFPSLDNKQGRIGIINRQQQIIDQLNYYEDWHLPFLSSKEGVSLERLSSEALTNDRNNWYSAAGTYGYATPGYANSQKQVNNITNDGIISITPEVFSPNGDGFNDFTTIEIKPSETGVLGAIKIFDSNGNMVRTLLQQQLISENDRFVWNGLSDTNKILPSGIYIVWLRTISKNGKVDERYKVVTLGNH